MAKKTVPESAGDKVTLVPLTDLHLDSHNPRLGGQAEGVTKEYLILDKIVEEFGVDDVLSSIAVNGYFQAEPVIGMRGKAGAGITIKEGNRRLAACLILSGDPRAKNQEKRTREFKSILDKHGREPISKIPVIVYEKAADSKRLLSYLGVRHIAASQPWDSFAKAAWIASVLESGELTLNDVSTMIGDQHRTVARLLEGYYFTKQLEDAGRFNPKDSQRRGRGSNPEYPFSWVYTVLGYKPVREWLELDDVKEEASPKPIKKAKLGDATDLMGFIFGDKSKSKPAVISDSREISDLAIAVGDPEGRELLRRGKSVKEVVELSRSAIDRVNSGLMDAQESLTKVLLPISQAEISSKEAQNLIDPSKKVRALANDVSEKIFGLAMGTKTSSDG